MFAANFLAILTLLSISCAQEPEQTKKASKGVPSAKAESMQETFSGGLVINLEIPPPPPDEWSEYTVSIKNEFDLKLKANSSKLTS